MKPRRHTQSESRATLSNCELPMWRGNLAEEDEVRCAYCWSETHHHYDPGCWEISFEEHRAAFIRANKWRDFGLPKGHPHTILRGEIVERKVCLHICPKCGWWVAEDRAIIPAKHWQYWQITLASAPTLLDLKLNDIETPMQEVRRYLSRAFEQRVEMHPRLFELTVASVFADFGYKPVVTAYSNDAGIDVILQGSGERIGVQVKRQKNSVGVEQIREFLGALVFGGFRRGAFVSTSRFSKAATQAARKITEVIMPIELVDSERFFDILGCAQLNQALAPTECIANSKKLKFQLQYYHHLKTL